MTTAKFQPRSSLKQDQKRTAKNLEKKLQSKLDGRWTIIGLFSLTILASLFFYLQTQLPEFWQNVSGSIVISSVSEKEKFDPTPILKEVQSLTKDLRGVYGVYVYRLTDRQEYGLYQDEVLPAASLMKLPVMLTIYLEAEKGNFSLETEYELKAEDKVGGAGILYGKPIGSTYTYRQMLEYMGHYSDNTAYKAFLRILGQEKIQSVISAVGMAETNLNENETSPEDIGLFFRKLYRGELLSTAHQEELLGFLTQTGFEDRIPSGLPEDVRVAHKIGTEIGNYSDAGIVFSQKPFVLVIISENARESEALESLPKITAAVWGFESVSSE